MDYQVENYWSEQIVYDAIVNNTTRKLMSELPIIGLLSENVSARQQNGRMFGCDMAMLLAQAYAEWLGLFGYPHGQILPGFRVPLPMQIVKECHEDKTLFLKLSADYFSSFEFMPADFTFGGNQALPECLVPALYFYKGLDWQVCDLERFLKALHKASGRHKFYEKENDWFKVIESDASNTPLKKLEKLSFLIPWFFPPAFRYFWSVIPRIFISDFVFRVFFHRKFIND